MDCIEIVSYLGTAVVIGWILWGAFTEPDRYMQNRKSND